MNTSLCWWDLPRNSIFTLTHFSMSINDQYLNFWSETQKWPLCNCLLINTIFNHILLVSLDQQLYNNSNIKKDSLWKMECNVYWRPASHLFTFILITKSELQYSLCYRIYTAGDCYSFKNTVIWHWIMVSPISDIQTLWIINTETSTNFKSDLWLTDKQESSYKFSCSPASNVL
jgi:hypothetical protein